MTPLTQIHGKKVVVNGKQIALFYYKDEFYAIDEKCPHLGQSEGTKFKLGVWYKLHHSKYYGDVAESPLNLPIVLHFLFGALHIRPCHIILFSPTYYSQDLTYYSPTCIIILKTI